MKKILKSPVFQISLILILVTIVYFNVFKVPFIWDDEVQIVGNQFVTNSGFFKEIFTSTVMQGGSGPGGASFYRPLVVLFYRFEYILFGLNPAGFHLISLLFHFLNIVLIYSLVRKITQKYLLKLTSLAPFLACFLFAFHPINVEAVSWIAVQGDLVAASALLTSFFLLIFWAESGFQKRKYLIGAQCLFCSALFIKEPTIIFPLIFFIYLLIFYPIRKNFSNWVAYLKFILTSVATVSIYAVFRFLIAKIYFGSSLSLIGKASKMEHFLTDITSLGNYFKLIFFPSPLCSDRQFIISHVSDCRFIISALFLIFLIFLFIKFRKKISPIIHFFTAWFFIGILITINFLFPGGPVMAERYLYFPAIGLIILIAFGLSYIFQKPSKRWRFFLIFLFIINFAFWGYKIWTRNQQWQSPLSFYQHDAQLSQNSFLLETNLGVEYFRHKNFDEAEKAFLRAIEIEPSYGVAHNNLGVILKQKGKTEEAVSEYKKAITLSNYYLAYINLGDIYFTNQNYKEAILLLKRASNFFPYNSAVLSRLALAYWQTEDFEKARAIAVRLLAINPNDQLAKSILQGK